MRKIIAALVVSLFASVAFAQEESEWVPYRHPQTGKAVSIKKEHKEVLDLVKEADRDKIATILFFCGDHKIDGEIIIEGVTLDDVIWLHARANRPDTPIWIQVMGFLIVLGIFAAIVIVSQIRRRRERKPPS